MDGYNGFSLEELRYIDYCNHLEKKINLDDYIEKNKIKQKAYSSNSGTRSPFNKSHTSYSRYGSNR